MELHKRQNYYILTGDLNAKHTLWGNKENNRALAQWIERYEFKFRINLLYLSSPTFSWAGLILDIILANQRIHVWKKNLRTNEPITYTHFHMKDHKRRSARSAIRGYNQCNLQELHQEHNQRTYINLHRTDWTSKRTWSVTEDPRRHKFNQTRNEQIHRISKYTLH